MSVNSCAFIKVKKFNGVGWVHLISISSMLLIGAFLLGVIISTALYGVYNYLVTNFGNLLHLEQVVWGMKNFVAALTQGFFAYRVWKLSQGYKWIFVIALLLILIEFTIVFVYAVRGSRHLFKLQKNQSIFNLQGLDIVNFLLAAVVDTYSLKLAFKEQTQSLINCITAIAAACADILAPDTLVNLGIFFCIGRRLYLFAP
ncbi:hypothetical protein EV360DRAFT_74991 [Lentinula raphanica]|nr:hypothetical protein EV360DRAFT_74991 [Lentinula raphanica]